MSEAPSYADMKARGAEEFLTAGPNSGGVEGLLVLDGRVWQFYADWDPVVGPTSMPADVFLERHGDSDRRGYREAVAFLRRVMARPVSG